MKDLSIICAEVGAFIACSAGTNSIFYYALAACKETAKKLSRSLVTKRHADTTLITQEYGRCNR